MKYFNCNKYEHFAAKFHLNKKEEKANIVEIEKEFAQLMAITEEHEKILLQGIPQHNTHMLKVCYT